MSTGLIALLDDIAALAKMAAVTLDDAAAQVPEAYRAMVARYFAIVARDSAERP